MQEAFGTDKFTLYTRSTLVLVVPYILVYTYEHMHTHAGILYMYANVCIADYQYNPSECMHAFMLVHGMRLCSVHIRTHRRMNVSLLVQTKACVWTGKQAGRQAGRIGR